MILRRATIQDLPFIVALEQQLRGLNLVGAEDLATHDRRMNDPDCQYWIAGHQESQAGHVILRGVQSVNRSIELMRIVVSEPDQGLGRAILNALVSKVFDELGAHRLWLDVFEHNARARHVYRSVGFVEEGVLRECVRQPGQYASLVVMSILEDEYRARVRKIQ
ncbi:MAG TPA: GNAT family N-acetyltransferase [Bryobacteraceae bacterium]|nr:GNAT family N-acetyltransferase [Bryobacteraceae bacterium]